MECLGEEDKAASLSGRLWDTKAAVYKGVLPNTEDKDLAEREGFEPSIQVLARFSNCSG